jgi:hypothetical protein
MRLGVVSDLHAETDPPHARRAINPYEQDEVEARLETAVEVFRAAGVDVVALLGDVSERDERPALDRVLALLGGTTAPVVAVRGNHDGDALSAAAAAHGVRMLAPEPWTAAEIPLVGVDAVAVEPGLPIFESAGAPPTGDGLAVVASHFPVLSQAPLLAAAGLPYYGDLVDRAALARMLGGRGQPIVVLNGHIHARCSAANAQLLQLSVGALVEPPFDCTIVDVDVDLGAGVVVTRQAVRLGSVAQVNPVFAPDEERWRYTGGRWRRDAVSEPMRL